MQLGLHQLCAMALKRSHTRSCLSSEGAPPQIFSTHSLVSSSFIHARILAHAYDVGMLATSFGIRFPLNTTKGRSLVPSAIAVRQTVMRCLLCPVINIGTDVLPLTAMAGMLAHIAVSSMLLIQCIGTRCSSRLVLHDLTYWVTFLSLCRCCPTEVYCHVTKPQHCMKRATHLALA